MPVVGYEGFYEVSDQGNVRSLDRYIHHKGHAKPRFYKGKVLKQFVSVGYPAVSLCRNDSGRVMMVHRLVASAFIGECPEKYVVCHCDGNEFNNTPENLRYDTYSENSKDVVRHGNHQDANKTHCKRGHPLEYPNLVVGKSKKGHRNCLACDRASSYVLGHPNLVPKVWEIADKYYERISA